MDNQTFSAANTYSDFNQDTVNITKDLSQISGTHRTQHTISTFSTDNVFSYVSNDALNEAVSMRPSLANSVDKDIELVHASHNLLVNVSYIISAAGSYDNAPAFTEAKERTKSYLSMYSSLNSQHFQVSDQDNSNTQALFDLSQES